MFAAQSETLKYLFLLFSDGDTIPLSSELGKKKPTCESAPQLIVCLTFAEYVFNTEVRRCPVISFDASSLTCHLTRIGPPASNFQSLHPNRFHLNAPVHVYACLLIYDQDYYLMSLYIIIWRTVNFVTLKLDSNKMGNHYKGYVFTDQRYLSHILVKDMQIKSLLTAVFKKRKEWYMTVSQRTTIVPL